MTPGDEIFSAGACPVCAGAGALLFVRDAVGGRVFVFCPGCGVAWREIPPAFELNEILAPSTLAPTGLQVATLREIEAAGFAADVSESVRRADWQSAIAEYLAP